MEHFGEGERAFYYYLVKLRQDSSPSVTAREI